ncbi:MAG: EamA family transporter [Candidatus Sericytochromatia bacterium]|nr:EamA family transporter [Candidatus Sericytochromatia bacterium]
MSPATIALTLATIVLWGVIPLIDKVAVGHAAVSPLVGIAIRATAVVVLAVPLALWAGDAGPALRALPWRVVGLYAASGVVSLLLAQYAYYTLLRQADVARVFPLLFAAAPVVTVGLAIALLGESLTPRQALGTLLIVGGGLLML